MKKELLVIGILGVLILSGCTVNAVTFSNTKNSEKSVVVDRYVKSCISGDSPNVPVNSYIDSDGSQVTQVGENTKAIFKMNKNNGITSAGTSSVSGNGGGLNLVFEEFNVYYVNPTVHPTDDLWCNIMWEFGVCNEGDNYTFPTSWIFCNFTLYFNWGDERDFNVNVYRSNRSDTLGRPMVWEHGRWEGFGGSWYINPDLGKPKNMIGVFEVFPKTPDITTSKLTRTTYLHDCIFVDYKVVNLTGVPVELAKVWAPWMDFPSGSSFGFYSYSSKNGEGWVLVYPKEPYDVAYSYTVKATRDDKYQLNTTKPVKEGAVTNLGFVLDVTGYFPNNPPNTPTCIYDRRNNVLLVTTTDIDGDQVYFGISWQNNKNVDEWWGPYQSGETAKIDCTGHTQPGTVGVIAEDEHFAQSDWVAVKSISANPFVNFLTQKISAIASIINQIIKSLASNQNVAISHPATPQLPTTPTTPTNPVNPTTPTTPTTPVNPTTPTTPQQSTGFSVNAVVSTGNLHIWNFSSSTPFKINKFGDETNCSTYNKYHTHTYPTSSTDKTYTWSATSIDGYTTTGKITIHGTGLPPQSSGSSSSALPTSGSSAS